MTKEEIMQKVDALNRECQADGYFPGWEEIESKATLEGWSDDDAAAAEEYNQYLHLEYLWDNGVPSKRLGELRRKWIKRN